MLVSDMSVNVTSTQRLMTHRAVSSESSDGSVPDAAAAVSGGGVSVCPGPECPAVCQRRSWDCEHSRDVEEGGGSMYISVTGEVGRVRGTVILRPTDDTYLLEIST